MDRSRSRGWTWGAAAACVVGAIAWTIRGGLAPFVASAARATASGFLPTVENKTPAPGPAPDGMVWIPGGEFSMGSAVEGESLCCQPGVTRDAQPIHRVYVDGFWMDKTEV